MSSTSSDELDHTGSEHQFTVIAKAETKDVARLRWVVAAVLICSAVGVAVSANYYIKNSEASQFRTRFEDDSEKVLQAIGSSMDKTLGLLDGLAVTLVSYARHSNQSWPCVTLPDFAVRMSKVVPLTDAVNINVLPIVMDETRLKWEDYARQNNQWVEEAVTVQDSWDGYYGPIGLYNGVYNNVVHGDFADIPYKTGRKLLPLWQNFPVIANNSYTYNWDWMSLSVNATYDSCITDHLAVVSKPYMIPDPNNPIEVAETQAWAEYYRAFISPDEVAEEPMSDLVYPIVNEIDRVVVTGAGDYVAAEHHAVAMIGSSFYWRSLLKNILPKGSDGIHIVFDNPCTASFAYQLNGPETVYLGVNHQHETKYTSMGKRRRLDSLVGRLSGRDSVYSGAPLNDKYCPITLFIYPSEDMQSQFTTNDSTIFTMAAVVIFAFTSLVFYWFNSKVEHRQRTVLKTAVESNAIVSSLFPSGVRERLFPNGPNSDGREKDETAKSKLRAFIAHGKEPSVRMGSTTGSNPIADLYPDTTVLFADIAGFTAWSSVRNPTQVFCLLEAIYSAFDEIAKKRGVFKVETIGDSYVAVAGLPTPHKQHAVIMARFADECRAKMGELTTELDKTLGPGTADLAMRFGLNSGPTTGGVLRGEKSRFQLFGDTVNTAARMESNGLPGEIQVSQKTADLLMLAGKGHWLTPRSDTLDVKGKGAMASFWCNPRGSTGLLCDPSGNDDGVDFDNSMFPLGEANVRLDALVTWNCNLFMELLKDVVAAQTSSSDGTKSTSVVGKDVNETGWSPQSPPRDEVREVLELPKSASRKLTKVDTTRISTSASEQLRELIAEIAYLYQNNPFHNFDHCCHVVMSTKKLLDRMSELETNDPSVADNAMSRTCSDAIARNPLTRLAIVFAALIHDVDHPGVSNAQLVQERNVMAVSYDGKSVAEQNSVDVTWRLLMEPRFAELRRHLFGSTKDMAQFRAILVNSVMATDLFDAQLKALRESRWTKSFLEASPSLDHTNRRATIVIDLIIQASDVSHTMQHFTVYQKWNQRLLTEMYEAYVCGRTAKDPLDGWYEGELCFFDNYVIPLAQKLRECGVFGVSCDEFLDYARDNRMEWEVKGRDIVRAAAESLKKSCLHGEKAVDSKAVDIRTNSHTDHGQGSGGATGTTVAKSGKTFGVPHFFI